MPERNDHLPERPPPRVTKDAPGWYYAPAPGVSIWLHGPLHGGIEDADFEILPDDDPPCLPPG